MVTNDSCYVGVKKGVTCDIYTVDGSQVLLTS